MRVLALSPHTDDAELGAGGYIARLVDEGNEVRCVAFSTGNPLTGATVTEFRRSMEVLGIESHQCWNMECRHFPEYRQTILGYLIVEREEYRPDLVLVPSKANVHQDHEVVTNEAIRAFRCSNLLGYEMPWGDVRPFYPQYYVELTAEYIKQKSRALQRYESQWLSRPYMNSRAIEAILEMRGMQIQKSWAEAFEVVRWLV